MTIDQRGSTGDQDRVPSFLAQVGRLELPGPAHPVFERSVGDEVQGVVREASAVVEIALHALREGRWYVGIGVGSVSLPPDASPREGTGTAFVAARRAVEHAKSAGSQVPLSVVPGIMAGEAGRGVPAGRGSGRVPTRKQCSGCSAGLSRTARKPSGGWWMPCAAWVLVARARARMEARSRWPVNLESRSNR
ncbi:MarR family transcriptional regulator [Arthrobacter sp. FX8]|uniref:MarR family transcriptional regulator n=1 Tax=Arthrobacter sp. FX8 TaxID=2997335 RepID=UPI00227BC515|nr:MarR family transcriptional regulator [Arthrobacter sp. FX8]WAJ34123.1 MarR family transcriptional regulator [Arthrobacter sp. FX8]